MKKNAQRILFSLYSPEDKKNNFYKSYNYLSVLFPELSSGGIRSLMKKLSDEGWVAKTTINNRTFFHLTQLGQYQLYDCYPFLKPTKRSSNALHIVVAIKPPSSDPQFFKLRALLASYQAVKLNRGVYLLLHTPQEELLRALLKTYNLSVMVIAIKDFVFGELHQLELAILSTHALKSTLSGVGNKIKSLLTVSDSEKRLNSYTKAHFYSSFCQIEEMVRDCAISEAIPKEIITQLRDLILEWESVQQQYFQQ